MAGADSMAIEEVVRKVMTEHGDVIRESVRWVVQEVMEAEVSELIGAQRGERSEDRATHRNGYRAGAGTRARAKWSCRSPSCGGAAISRRFSGPASARSRRWCPWC